MRTPKLAVPPDRAVAPREKLVEVEIQLITRLFGGGATARELDPVCWLRSSAFKSALRNWWRIGFAHTFKDLDALREREEYLFFGSSARFGSKNKILGGPGILSVEVESKMAPTPEECTLGAGDALTYAYFPARRERNEAHGKTLGLSNAKAAVRLIARWPAPENDEASLPSRKAEHERDREQLLEALRLWVVFGGVGARTRRGAGAVALTSEAAAKKLGVPTDRSSLERFVAARCEKKDIPEDLGAVFSFARPLGAFVGSRSTLTAEAAQTELLRAYKAFRQDRKSGAGNRPGRTNWEEADAIRAIDRPGFDWGHRPEAKNLGKFPRSALGLPIVMHFKTEQGQEHTEPPDYTIEGTLDAEGTRAIDRYASPVLLRPVRIWEQEKACYLAVAIVTRGTLPDGAMPLLKTKDRAPALVPYPISASSTALADLSTHFGTTFKRLI